MLEPVKQLITRGNLQLVNSDRLATRQELMKHAAHGDIARLPKKYIDVIDAKERICKFLIEKNNAGIALNNAYENLKVNVLGQVINPIYAKLKEDLLMLSVGAKEMHSRSQIFAWIDKYKKHGRQGLASKHWFRVHKTQGWEGLALQIYNIPGQPNAATVARDLKRKHGIEVSIGQVRNYLNKLPTHLAVNSPERIGKHLFSQREAPYVKRHANDVLVGEIIMADGYRFDTYIADPMTGDIWRPEFMHAIDIKTGYLFGYAVMANEGSYDVMMGWASMIEKHNHVPPLNYVDRGSGYTNKLANDDVSGYLIRAGVQAVIKSLPKNAKGKGQIERYHKVVRDDFCKTWMPHFYCGPDMSADWLNETTRLVKAGKLQLPSLAELVAAYDAWLRDDYHQRPAANDKSITRAQAWGTLKPIPPYATAIEIARPSKQRIVQRAIIQIESRKYMHPDLIAFNGKSVLVELDIFNHQLVTIRSLDGFLICDAPLIKTVGIVSDSFLQDKRNKAELAAINRKEKQIAEIKARNGIVIDAEAVADNALSFDGEFTQIDDDQPLILDLTE
ncbi:MAG: transposase [Methylotenera sp.]|uniref:Mu transposase C-terminal domain-containing protein n=1 Tax=Methylotenera sp. TaxID=2051956 RepID=UPI001821B669|nr:Mu transposase C-terminal domain-containing protein [Methylotenera sp.]NOU25501.1 transposase [Methylotenera sp.]